MLRKAKTPGRNDKCPCNSGLKFKKCCFTKIRYFNSLTREQKQELYVDNLLLTPKLQAALDKAQKKTKEVVPIQETLTDQIARATTRG